MAGFSYPYTFNNPLTVDAISKQIMEVFERILSEVRTRRDELLEQVIRMKMEFRTKDISVDQNLRELEGLRAHFEKMSVKQNLAMKKQRDSLADIDSEIRKLRAGLIQDCKLKFNCSINQLIEQVKHFGQVIDESCVISKYKSKLTATQVISVDPKIPYSPKLHIDYANQILYLLDYTYCQKNDRKPIAVFTANHFTYLAQFGEKGRSAECMAIGNEFIYVGYKSSYDGKLMLYNKSDYSLIKKCNDLSGTHICNICSTSDNKVFVLCISQSTYKLHIYDRALNYREKINLSYQDINYCVSSLIRSEKFYILTYNELIVCNKKGNVVRSIFNTKGNIIIDTNVCLFIIVCLGKELLKNPTSFCVDEAGNFIFIDSDTNSIKFFSPEGDLFHTIGEDTVGSDVVVGATDIATYNGKVIVSTRDGHIRIY